MPVLHQCCVYIYSMLVVFDKHFFYSIISWRIHNMLLLRFIILFTTTAIGSHALIGQLTHA